MFIRETSRKPQKINANHTNAVDQTRGTAPGVVNKIGATTPDFLGGTPIGNLFPDACYEGCPTLAS